MVGKGSPDECWPWTGYTTSEGYGVMNPGRTGGTSKAHRVSYEVNIGPVPAGLQIHHTCENPGCVNPAHLKALTPGEHVRLHAAAITACPKGHEYDSRNTYHYRGRRCCRECNRVASLNYQHRKRVAA